MSLALPYSRRRRYLTGIDWLVGMLDHMTRRSCGVGNRSQVVLELDSGLPEETLRASLAGFLDRLPFLRGEPARDLNLAPYWRRGTGDRAGLELSVVRLPADAAQASVLAALAAGVQRPTETSTRRLSFLWLTLGERLSYLAMAFDHRLLDARGAEMLLSLFLEHLDGRPVAERLRALDTPEPARLDRWLDRHHAGRRVVAHLRWLREGTVAYLPRPPVLSSPHTGFALVSFDRDQTHRIVEAAYREAGYLMLQSFLLAAVLQALDPLFRARLEGSPAPRPSEYVVPVSVDMRPPRGADALVFFNHLSFQLFRIPAALVPDRARLAEHIRDQMVAQVKAGLPQDIADASDLLRILPLPLLGRIARISMKGEFGSFSFAQLTSTNLYEPAPLRGRVLNLFHMPRIPVPPAFGVVANQFAGRLNLVVSAHEEVVTPAELAEIAMRLQQLPAACPSPVASPARVAAEAPPRTASRFA